MEKKLANVCDHAATTFHRVCFDRNAVRTTKMKSTLMLRIKLFDKIGPLTFFRVTFFVLSFIANFSNSSLFNDLCLLKDDSGFDDRFYTEGIGDYMRGQPCTPNPKYNISCWDEFRTWPDLASVDFNHTGLPKNMIECRAVNSDPRYVICDRRNWTVVHRSQVRIQDS